MLRGSLSFDSSTSAGLRVTCVYPGFIPASHYRRLVPRLRESSSILRIIACIGFNCRLVDDQNADLRPRSGPYVEGMQPWIRRRHILAVHLTHYATHIRIGPPTGSRRCTNLPVSRSSVSSWFGLSTDGSVKRHHTIRRSWQGLVQRMSLISHPLGITRLLNVVSGLRSPWTLGAVSHRNPPPPFTHIPLWYKRMSLALVPPQALDRLSRTLPRPLLSTCSPVLFGLR